MSPRSTALSNAAAIRLAVSTHDADQRSIRGLDAAVGDKLDQRFGKVEQSGDAVVGSLEFGRRQVDAPAEVAEFVDDHVAMREVRGGRLGDPIDLPADRGEAVLHPHDNALDLLGAFAGALGPQRGVAAFADQIADLTVEIANGIADQMRRLARRLGEALDLARDHGKALSRVAGTGGLDGRIQREQVGLLGDRLDRAGYLGDLRERGPDRTEPALDAVDGFDQCGDMLDRRLHGGARLGDFADGGRGSELHRPRRVCNLVIGRDHGFGGLLQMPEPVGLTANTAGDFLQIARHIREFDPKAADPVRKPIDQTFAI